MEHVASCDGMAASASATEDRDLSGSESQESTAGRLKAPMSPRCDQKPNYCFNDSTCGPFYMGVDRHFDF